MKTFASLVKKEFTHILRDVRTMLIVLLLPVVLIVLFGFAISTEVNNIDIAAVVPHPTTSINQQIDQLSNNPYFTYQGTITQVQVDEVLRTGKADAVLVYDQDGKMQIVLDASNSSMSTSVQQYLMQALSSSPDNSQHSTLNTQLFTTYMRHNPQLKSAYNFVPGVMGLIFILICALMTCVSVVKEKETGTMEVLLVSPVKPLYVIIAKMIPYFVLSCVNLTTILLLAHYVLEMPMVGSMATLIGISMLYLFLALALGLFVSNMAKSQMVALLICAMMMLIPMMMLSGMIFPIENLPIILKQITYIVPARWYNEALKKVMIEGLGFLDVWKEVLILSAMTLVLVVASLKKFNDRLE